MTYDFCVIGGGIVGLATAMRLLEAKPGASLLLVEKEDSFAKHQTDHNSGVIHAGVYYTPGSFKAKLCARGAQATKDFCEQHNIEYEVCGKLLVASSTAKLVLMDKIAERARQNGLTIDRLDAQELHRRESNIIGAGALFVESTGIVDYKAVASTMFKMIARAGGEVVCGHNVISIKECGNHVTVTSDSTSWKAKKLVVCAGLQSDRLAVMAGLKVDFQIIPFRGEYYRLPPSRNESIKHLIYPIPDPNLPFLGIHLTRMIDGSIKVGPNAVLSLSREGYRKLSFNARDILEYSLYPGFWRFIRKHFVSGVQEIKNTLFKAGYLEQCKKYYPSLELQDLQPCKAGIRAQAVMRSGDCIEDFLFMQTPRMLHVCNAPSPAATAAIPIGEMITDKLLKSL